MTQRRTFLGAALAGAGMCLACTANANLVDTHSAWPTHTSSQQAQTLVRWVRATADHQERVWMVVDKPQAQVHVFAGNGTWLGSSAVLLGAAKGDYTAPGVAHKTMAQMRPQERTTPAGRFATEPGRNLRGDDIVWIDYDAAVSMHRVRSVNAGERRRERLASAGAHNKRISYGCINVPEAFFDQWIAPFFGRAPGVAYVLPDTAPFSAFFEAASLYAAKADAP